MANLLNRINNIANNVPQYRAMSTLENNKEFLAKNFLFIQEDDTTKVIFTIIEAETGLEFWTYLPKRMSAVSIIFLLKICGHKSNSFFI